ncbi:DUF4421 family protein [Lacinutrix neustonica]|uniref:DUF4421 family protein n=1 Tax=Lacinutrix neustonica TaxID=2980107 RepID=A0A9E8SHY5_9FLAO|nr:DUF4421 family protein [Lacinutrix neustonica]WAC03170.1 DUF4421 family protein [Lacinutrix neustonica]
MKQALLVVITFIFTSSYAQDIVDFSNKMLVKVDFNKQSESFLITDDGERSFIVEANNVYKLKCSANYKFLGLSINFSPSSTHGNNQSKFRNIQLRVFLKQWLQTFEYRKVQGFYQERTNINTTLAAFPNLKTTSFTGSTSYTLNDNFSLKHLVALNEWQKSSAGSLVPTLNYGFNRLSDVNETGKYFQNNFDISISPMYYYTRTIKTNYFVTGGIAPALGIRFSNEKSEHSNASYSFVTKALNFKLQFGYTTNSISTGAVFNFDSSEAKKASARNFVNDKSYASLYFGYRFDPPPFLKQSSKWVKEQIDL